jgi:uncharacterized protein YihD (DUF1040 family)
MKLFGQPPRDPARIDEILSDLSKIWKKYPDLRFYQMLSCFESEYVKRDKFYVEDSDLQEGIAKYKRLRSMN